MKRRSPVRVGPGLLAAGVIAVALLWSGRLRPVAPRSPILVPAARRPAPPFPDVETLLRQKERLRLTPAQVARLQALRREWEHRTADRRAGLEARSEEMGGYLKEAQARGRLVVEDLKRRGIDYQAVSASVAAERRRYWAKGLALLTPDQRQRLEGGR